jgi:ankyrin repeat protein
MPLALIAAAAAGDAERVGQLIRERTPLDAQDAQGRTALLIAVLRGDAAIARALVAAGASVNVQAQNQDTPWLLVQ